jgi:putative membrane protein
MRFLIRVVLNAAAIALASNLIPGIRIAGLVPALAAGLVFGIVNAVVRPVLVVLTLPISIITLGLFIFVVNALCFWLTSALVPGFDVAGFWPAFVGALVTSVVGWIVSLLVRDA